MYLITDVWFNDEQHLEEAFKEVESPPGIGEEQKTHLCHVLSKIKKKHVTTHVVRLLFT